MILDSQSRFSGVINADGTVTPQAITGTAVSQNVIDLRSAGSGLPALVDEGIDGTDCYLVVQTNQAFNTLTSLTITLESDVATSLASAPVVHFSKTIALAGLTANTQLVRVLLPSDDYKRYLGVRYTVTGTNPSQGTVQAFIALTPQRNVNYPTRIQVL